MPSPPDAPRRGRAVRPEYINIRGQRQQIPGSQVYYNRRRAKKTRSRPRRTGKNLKKFPNIQLDTPIGFLEKFPGLPHSGCHFSSTFRPLFVGRVRYRLRFVYPSPAHHAIGTVCGRRKNLSESVSRSKISKCPIAEICQKPTALPHP